ncbi:LysR family transcriptional regulator [Leucobacter sp. wl10]|uniref:LysR substrate-binding domain-containing protein n=1 Tax=Leucobacter sp. wl10 TaxID=2304677 RepID=UPI000E5C2847|nr:LysR family transcriptional regulator [Leucobacter sp. wl10]RGE24259.1 LysR family transcriptional regulator [Leucobacter sp. wl10]
MDIHHLRYFLVLSEELHFGRAAQRLHMAQPPLSQRIKSLERELGVELFHRRRTGVELSEAGALLLEHARAVLEKMSEAEAAMGRIRPGASGVIRVALPPDTNPVTIEALIEEFAASTPGVLLDLHELSTEEQIPRLRDGELDVAVVRHPISAVGLESGPVTSRPLVAILREDDPLAQSGRAVSLGALTGQPLVLFQRYMAPMLYDEILSTCRDAGYLPSAMLHARNQNFAHGLVLGRRGVYLHEAPWNQLPPGLVWRSLEGDPLSWRTSAMWLKTRRTEVTDALVRAVTIGLESGGHAVSRQ